MNVEVLSSKPYNQVSYRQKTMNENFCLKWKDFKSNASKTFGIIRDEDFLQDVTLVGDDNAQIAAHKHVLSACSEYFKNIFINNKHSHPLLCL